MMLSGDVARRTHLLALVGERLHDPRAGRRSASGPQTELAVDGHTGGPEEKPRASLTVCTS
jgi:hypothetical protein